MPSLVKTCLGASKGLRLESPGEIAEVGAMPAAREEIRETAHDLTRQIAEKALQLSDLEVVLEDCQRKREMILQDLRALREKLWDLRDASPARSTRNLV